MRRLGLMMTTVAILIGALEASAPPRLDPNDAKVETRSPTPEKGPDLHLRLSTGKGIYVLYEPVELTYELSNRGTETATSDILMPFAFGDLAVWIEQVGQPPVRFRTGEIADVMMT